ncbi:MAG: hypothetical protein ACP5E4_03115 [Candidatus Aenigmatarchaeota archaeon]
MKAQVSMEYMIVVGFGLFFLAVYTISSYSTIYSYRQGNDAYLVKDSLEKMGSVAEFVSLQGAPARQTAGVCFPQSFAGCSIDADNRTISCSLDGGQSISGTMPVDVSGTLPASSGCWKVMLESIEDGSGAAYVNITVQS